MEQCNTYKPWHDKTTGKTFLKFDQGKCLHYYFYFSGHDVCSGQLNLYRNILNVGTGDNPIPCAINIDIDPRASGVIFGDVNNLSQFSSGQFDHIIALNPYRYNIFESDVPRVLKDGGVITVTGNYSNKYFKKVYNASPEMLRQAGFEIVAGHCLHTPTTFPATSPQGADRKGDATDGYNRRGNG